MGDDEEPILPGLPGGKPFVATPSEPRPFFEFLKAHPGHGFVTFFGAPGSPYIFIAPDGAVGQSVQIERVTHEEYATLNGIIATGTAHLDPDTLVLGGGPMMGVNVIATHKLTLRECDRGLILPPQLEIMGNEVVASGPIDPQLLRSSTLLWDHLDWPESNLLDIEPTEEIRLLLSEGIMVRSQFQFAGTIASKSDVKRLHLSTFEEAEKREPGLWSVAGLDGAPPLIETDPHASNALLISLYDAIPVPHCRVAMEDLLEFKRQRRDELLALRIELERIYQRVLAAPDRVRAEKTELTALKLAIDNHTKVIEEAGMPTVLGALKAKILEKAPGAAFTAFNAWITGSPGPLALGLGAANLGVEVTGGMVFGQKEEANSPFQYISSFRKNLYSGTLPRN